MSVRAYAYPEELKPEIRQFMSKYYHLSNAASTHNDHEEDEEAFADLFTKNGTYTFGRTSAKGKEAIMKMRRDMFDNVPHRDHPILKLYTHGGNDRDLMALGEFSHKRKSGKEVKDLWAARYILVEVDGQMKLESVAIVIDASHEDDFVS